MKRQPSSSLASALGSFFTDYLPQQRGMSPHTIESYRDSLKLFLLFVSGKHASPNALTMQDLSTKQVTTFLQHLESVRHNQASTRNVRLSAIHAFFRFVGARYPEHLAQVQQILGVPFKRTTLREMQHLELAEIEAILRGIDRSSRDGLRDFALLSFMFNTGARISEVMAVQACDLRLDSPPSVFLRGKGRKERVCPLWPETARVLRLHLERSQIALHEPHNIFRNHRGHPLTRFGAGLILKKHIRKTAMRVKSLARKRIHPHSIRHSTAVHLLRSGVDLSTIANWLGHVSINTTNKYLNLDLETKRDALRRTKPITSGKQRSKSWRSNRDLIKWLESL